MLLRRALLALVLASTLALPAQATWSIVVVNRRTGEVAIGSATCIARINLSRGLPSFIPGVGGGVIQASGSSTDHLALTEGLRQGLVPADILELVLAAEPSPRQLQTGIVALYPGAPVTFTGTSVGRAKAGVTGEVGDLAYAIQGNVITGAAVVEAAEAALLGTDGDLGQRLLAAMEAARDFGGDGRCSCDFSDADGCGSPPPSFEKSAHVGFLLVARVGDDVPPCVVGNDCAEGRIHLRLNIRGADADENDPDPVDQLAERYVEWRAERAGRPDGLLSRVEHPGAMPADGRTSRSVIVQLVDVDGVPLTHGGADVRVTGADGSPPRARISPVHDLGDGRYRFTVAATPRTGTDRLVITAEDDLVRATLYPFLEVRFDPPAPLHAGAETLSAAAGGSVPFVLSLPELPGAQYLLLASASGTSPATPLRFGGRPLSLPLVRDAWSTLSARHAGAAFLPGTRGTLDEGGRAEAAFRVPPGALLPAIGLRLSWAAVAVDGARATATNAVGFEIVP